MRERNLPDWFASVGIRGRKVALEPLTTQHEKDLAAAGRDPAIWRWLPTAHHMPGSMEKFIEQANKAVAAQSAVVFATIDLITQKAIGSTRYHHIAPEHLRLEIGVTWLATKFQQSHVNTEAKYLQLWYAFEKLKCRRVELKADVENLKSRAAISRLGATEEGIFRKHMLYADGRNRDNVYFSIIDDDWPLVRERLQQRLGYAVEPKIF